MKIRDITSKPIFIDPDVDYYETLAKYDSNNPASLVLPVLTKFPFAPAMNFENPGFSKFFHVLSGPLPPPPSFLSTEPSFLERSAKLSILKDKAWRVQTRISAEEKQQMIAAEKNTANSELNVTDLRIKEFFLDVRARKLIDELMHNIIRYQSSDQRQALNDMLIELRDGRNSTNRMLCEKSLCHFFPTADIPATLATFADVNLPEMLIQIFSAKSQGTARSLLELETIPAAHELAVSAIAAYNMVANLPVNAVSSPVQNLNTMTQQGVESVVNAISKKV